MSYTGTSYILIKETTCRVTVCQAYDHEYRLSLEISLEGGPQQLYM